jgi:hypothetical protein
MHTPDPHEYKPEEIDASQGYEQSDVRVSGIVVFLSALAILVVVLATVGYGVGKVINAYLNKQDGPDTKWSKSVEIRQLGNLPNNPAMQKKMAELTQTFPMPRVQTDDGNQDVADLHQREDLLLDNYTAVDGKPGKVRIPIERAMQLVAQQGLPVAPAATVQPLMTGEQKPTVTAPLTNGFARTAYEQEQAAAETAKEAGAKE